MLEYFNILLLKMPQIDPLLEAGHMLAADGLLTESDFVSGPSDLNNTLR